MKTRDIVDLILLGLIWGASFLFMRIAVPEFGPFALVEIRVAIAALVLLPIAAKQGQATSMQSNWQTLSILGAHNTALPFLLFAFATLTLTAGVAGILNATAPIFTAIVAWLWLGQSLTRGRTLGLLIGIAGVFLLVRNKTGTATDGFALAVCAGLGASLLYGIGANYTREKTAHVKPIAAAAGSQTAAAILLFPVAVMTWPEQMPSLAAWIAVVLLGLLSTGFAYILYYRLVANTGPTSAMTVTYLIPIWAMILGALIIGESITAEMLMGCGVVLLGTALATGVLKLSRRPG